MRPFLFGLAAGLAGAALAQVAATPDTRAGAPTHAVVAAASTIHPHAAGHRRGADPYAPLWRCREQVREFLSVSTRSVASRQQALEECIAAAAERAAQVATAGD